MGMFQYLKVTIFYMAWCPMPSCTMTSITLQSSSDDCINSLLVGASWSTTAWLTGDVCVPTFKLFHPPSDAAGGVHV
jgi:hypothetical protein